MKKWCWGLGLWLCLTAAWADIRLTGELTTGALIRGQVPPGSQVWLNERPLSVSGAGDFVFGFGRDAEADQKLRVRYPDGREETRPLRLARRDYPVQRINGVAQKYVEPDPKQVERIKSENQLVREARERHLDRRDFLQSFIWPAKGPISGVFGSQRIFNGQPRAPHYGVDVAAPAGAPVVAPAAGVVTLAHPDMFLSGGTLILDHGHGVSSTFIHLSEILVKPGQEVRQGELIARVGATGRATGPHLHWAMNWFDVRLDPALVVPPMGLAEGAGGRPAEGG